MVDILALAISHGLLALACWRLLWRDDLDNEGREPIRRRPLRPEMTAPGDDEGA